jgi:SAM-dependent methyltransferase
MTHPESPAHQRPDTRSSRPFDVTFWDERYRSQNTVWGVAPNRWVEQQLSDLHPGRAIDLACGEGRNAIWLASRGWSVTAVDFSAVAIEKGRAAATRLGVYIDWQVADVRDFAPPSSVDLALICYLQVPPAERRTVVRAAAAALAPGGTLLVVAHDSRNLSEGTGGPQDPSVLYTAADLLADLSDTDVHIEIAVEVQRPVEGAPRPALDALLRASRPTAP